jgi:polygalacturonase
MDEVNDERRRFLQAAGQLIAALPFLSMASPGLAETAKGTGVRQTSDHPAGASTLVSLNIRDFGAAGDAKTKDTLAIQEALDRCSVLGGGPVLVPKGGYLVGAIVLRSNTLLLLADGATLIGSHDLADYPLTQVRWEGRWTEGHMGLVSATDAVNIGIAGSGKIVGNEAIKGRVDPETQVRHPALLEFTSCKNVRVEHCVTIQNDMWSIHPTYCEDIAFRDLTVQGGADGIDVDSCRRVIIDGCTFSTGDDCISLKSGRGEEGYAIQRPTENVRITNCTFADSHWACIGIGSETSGGIRDVHVENCKCVAARTFAIYIKSRVGRGAYVKDIFMEDIEVSGAQQGFLRINTLDSGKQDEFPVPGVEGIPEIQGFHFSNVRVTDVPVLVQATSILPGKPLQGFSLTNVIGTCGMGIFLANTTQAVLHAINVTGFSGALLNIYNVTGTGLKGGAPLEATKIPAAIPPPAQPYSLH